MTAFQIGDLDMQAPAPTIEKWGFEDLVDDPAKHRWRAFWSGMNDVHAIELRAYPVIKANPSSVWINENGYREYTNQRDASGLQIRDWVPFNGTWMKKRILHDGAGTAWAKPTQDEAVRSLAVRLCRWTAHIRRDMKRAKSAIAVLEKLRPDWPEFVEVSRENLAWEDRQ